ncbi:MAG: YceD family protein [Coriobacteriales bacterium]
MQAFEQSIYPELAELGGVRRLSGVLDEPSYEVGGMVMETPAGWSYTATLTNTGEAILLQGEVSAVATTECARCLEPATVEVSAELQGYFLLNEADLSEGYEEDEVDAVDANGNFDISYNILASLCYATPFVVLCKDDCKGLCPHCGQDLNEASCDCAGKPDPMNPFAALAGLSFSEDDVARGQEAAREFGDAVATLPEEELPELSAEEAAELEKALSAIFEDGADGYLEFDEQGNLVFIEEEPQEPED